MPLNTEVLRSNQDAFGMLMPSRTYQAVGVDGYRFSFNGMEQDYEVKGDGNSLDFGARIYDSRLGRWMSPDPLFEKRPDQSVYKAFLNNPMIFIDPAGETEYLSITIVNKADNSSKTYLFVLDEDKVRVKVKWADNKLSDDESYHYEYYNIYHEKVYTIDKNGDVTEEIKGSTLSKTPKYIRHPLIKWFPHTPLEGEGGTQKGGYRLTSEDGGLVPTKQKIESDKPVDSKNIDAIGYITKGLGGNKIPKSLNSKIAVIANKIFAISSDNAKEYQKEQQALEGTVNVTLRDAPTIRTWAYGSTSEVYSSSTKDSMVKTKDFNSLNPKRIVNVKANDKK